jgi:hypothetical protein
MCSFHFRSGNPSPTSLFKTYLRPHLEFAIQAWSPPNIPEIMILEKVQRLKTDSINLSNKPVSRDSLGVTGPTGATRGNNKRVRSQSFGSREINDFYSSVTARMHFFTNRASRWWNKLPSNIVVAKTINSFKARSEKWLAINEAKLVCFFFLDYHYYYCLVLQLIVSYFCFGFVFYFVIYLSYVI